MGKTFKAEKTTQNCRQFFDGGDMSYLRERAEEEIIGLNRTEKQESFSEEQMRECLQQLFIRLSEASGDCEKELLPSITNSMLEVYKIFRTARF